MLAFLRSRGDDIEHFVPVNYYLLPQWIDENFFAKHKLFKGKRNPAIVVDFLYHPQAAFWFEHHPTTFKRASWKKNFRSDKQHRLEPERPSCTHLVYASLKKEFGWKPAQHLTELVKWLDVIDGARYRSARQTIEIKEPALQVNEFVDMKLHGAAEDAWIINMLATQPLSKIARIPRVANFVKRLRKKYAAGLAFIKKKTQVIGKVGFIDRTGSLLEFPHYGLYYEFPRINYFVRVSNRDGLCHVNAGISPWKKGNGTIHIGKLLMPFGGGGHETVGGVEFTTRKKAMDAARKIVDAINLSIKH